MDSRTLIALILAAGTVGAVLLLAASEALSEGHVTLEESSLFSTVLGALIGAVATYLGTTTRKEDRVTTEKPEPQETEEPEPEPNAEPDEEPTGHPQPEEGEDEGDVA